MDPRILGRRFWLTLGQLCMQSVMPSCMAHARPDNSTIPERIEQKHGKTTFVTKSLPRRAPRSIHLLQMVGGASYVRVLQLRHQQSSSSACRVCGQPVSQLFEYVEQEERFGGREKACSKTGERQDLLAPCRERRRARTCTRCKYAGDGEAQGSHGCCQISKSGVSCRPAGSLWPGATLLLVIPCGLQVTDLLSRFLGFQTFARNGLEARLEFFQSPALSLPLKKWAFNLCRNNMQASICNTHALI